MRIVSPKLLFQETIDTITKEIDLRLAALSARIN